MSASEQGGKPTAGPWIASPYSSVVGIAISAHPDPSKNTMIIAGTMQAGSKEEAEANADLIAEAGTVYHETGMTPRQLAEKLCEIDETKVRLAKSCSDLAAERNRLKQENAYLIGLLKDVERLARVSLPIQDGSPMHHLIKAALAQHIGKEG